MDLLTIVAKIINTRKREIRILWIKSLVFRCSYYKTKAVLLETLAVSVCMVLLNAFSVDLRSLLNSLVKQSGNILPVYSIFIAIIFGALAVSEKITVGAGMFRYLFEKTLLPLIVLHLLLLICICAYYNENNAKILEANVLSLFVFAGLLWLMRAAYILVKVLSLQSPYLLLNRELVREGELDAYSNVIAAVSNYYFDNKYVSAYSAFVLNRKATDEVKSCIGGYVINVNLGVFERLRKALCRDDSITCFIEPIYLGQQMKRNKLIATAHKFNLLTRLQIRIAVRRMIFAPFGTNERIAELADDVKSMAVGGRFDSARMMHKIIYNYIQKYIAVYSKIMPREALYHDAVKNQSYPPHDKMKSIIYDVLAYEAFMTGISRQDSIEDMLRRTYVSASINHCAPMMTLVIDAVYTHLYHSHSENEMMKWYNLLQGMIIDGIRQTLYDNLSGRLPNHFMSYIRVQSLKSVSNVMLWMIVKGRLELTIAFAKRYLEVIKSSPCDLSYDLVRQINSKWNLLIISVSSIIVSEYYDKDKKEMFDALFQLADLLINPFAQKELINYGDIIVGDNDEFRTRISYQASKEYALDIEQGGPHVGTYEIPQVEPNVKMAILILSVKVCADFSKNDVQESFALYSDEIEKLRLCYSIMRAALGWSISIFESRLNLACS